MSVLFWSLITLAVVYWLPRLFLNFLVPLFFKCEVSEVLPNIYKLGGLLSDTKNVYVLTGGALTLIDPGLFTPPRCIDRSLKMIGFRIEDVRFIIASHHHIDHAGSIGAVRKRSGASVIAHLADKPYIEGKRKRIYPLAPWYLRTILYLVHLLLHNYASIVDITVSDGQALEAQDDLIVVHTPGHTQGSICLYDSARRVLFSGDALQSFDGRVRRATEIYSENLNSDIQSILRLSELDFVHLLPSDGQPLLNVARSRLDQYLRALNADC